MDDKKKSKKYHLLPKLFDDLEEQIHSAVLNFYEEVIELIKVLDIKTNIKEFKTKLDQILERVIEYPEAMQILEEKGIIEQYNEGAREYVIKYLEKSLILNEFLEKSTEDFKDILIDYALKAFFDQLYELYKFAEEDGNPWW